MADEMNGERAIFEAWIGEFDCGPILEREEGIYLDWDVQRAWAAFQAGRASLAANAGSDPVAVVGSNFALYWAGSGPIAPIVEKHGIKVGSPLYTHPSPPEGMAGWQPIATAPIGRDMFIVRAFDVQVTDKISGYTSDAYGVWQPILGRFERWPHPFEPTHWMPLPPAPPIPASEAKGESHG